MGVAIPTVDARFKIDGVYCRLIPLTRGQYAIVCESHYMDISQFRWFAHFDRKLKKYYAVRNSQKPDGKRFALSMHRQILGLTYGDKVKVDHENHNTLDNRNGNLRRASPNQNQWNSGKRPINTSGFKGVGWYKKYKKWRAQIQANGVNRHIGYFDTPEAAHAAYCVEAERLHGDFAKLT